MILTSKPSYVLTKLYIVAWHDKADLCTHHSLACFQRCASSTHIPWLYSLFLVFSGLIIHLLSLSLPMSVDSLSTFTIQHSFTIPNGPELGFDGNAKWEVFLDEVQQKVCGCSVTLCFYMQWWRWKVSNNYDYEFRFLGPHIVNQTS